MTRMSGENLQQQLTVDWFHIQHAKYKDLFWHVPNGGKRSIITAIRLKLLGVKPGVPDLVLMTPRQGKHGLFVEMKDVIVKGKQKPKVSIDQLEKIDRLNQEGYSAHICYGFEQARKIIEWYLGG